MKNFIFLIKLDSFKIKPSNEGALRNKEVMIPC